MCIQTPPPSASRRLRATRQGGAVMLTVCFLLFFLLGFIAIAFDFGRLFIVKTELQTAMDSCALAAAQELDGQASALTRARNAGIAAGNMNRVNLQSSTWDGKGNVVDTDISFKDAAYLATTAAAGARYAQCAHQQDGVRMWLLHAMGAFTGDSAANPATRQVAASAVATRASAQSTCPIPVALKARLGGTPANNFGFQVGEWVLAFDKAIASAGEMGWYNLDGSRNASETAAELAEGGRCGTRIGDTLGTPGAQTSVDRPWNYRFGLYKNSDSPSLNHPDQTGYAYTTGNWTNLVPQNAFSGTPAAGSHPTAKNYLLKRAAYASLDDIGTSVSDASNILYPGVKNMFNSFQKLATPGATGEHKQYGTNRRLAVVPVINDANQVINYVCMFMLHPLSGPNVSAWLEYRGLAGIPDSPCAASGQPGGSAGPLVPVLVR